MSLGLASEKQQQYIEILLNDLGFKPKEADAFITELIGREHTFLDALSKSEASNVITALLQYKDNTQEKPNETENDSFDF